MESLMTHVIPKVKVMLRINQEYLKSTLFTNQSVFDECLFLPISHELTTTEEQELEALNSDTIIDSITKVIDLIETAQV